LFLPVPKIGQRQEGGGKREKPLALGILFLVAASLLRFGVWSLGVDVWLPSAPLRFAVTAMIGIQSVVSYGFFYLSWLRGSSRRGSENRTGLFCPFVFSLALIIAVTVRHFFTGILETAGSEKAVGFLFNSIKLNIVCQSIASVLCLFFLNRRGEPELSGAADIRPTDIHPADIHPMGVLPAAVATNRPLIFALICLSAVFTIINAVMEIRLFPFVNYRPGGYRPFLPMLAVAVPFFAFLAGRSIHRFIRLFLPPAVVLFILLPSLPLLEGYSLFNLAMGTLVTVFHFTLWVTFTTAIVECYAGGFWFYGLAAAIYITNVFSFFGPFVSPLISSGAEFTVLYIAVSAVLFALLSYRILLPKAALLEAAAPQAVQSLDIDAQFRERKLTKREAEIARLIVEKGYGNKDLADKLFLATGTVEQYVSSIYRKFKVKGRAEFVSLFVGK